MIKNFFLLILSIGISTTTYSQVEFGLKAGYNRANLSYSGPSLYTFGARSDFNAGVFASIPFCSHFSLQPELMYSGQGTWATDSIPTSASYDYLNVPVLIKYQHASGLFAETGPQVGFLLNAQLQINNQSVDAKGYTQSTDFSWVFGIGYKIPVINLGIDLRYNWGLTNTNKETNSGAAKNSVFQLDLFYQFKML
jgi:Outer membrane protein beta-barrel domain